MPRGALAILNLFLNVWGRGGVRFFSPGGLFGFLATFSSSLLYSESLPECDKSCPPNALFRAAETRSEEPGGPPSRLRRGDAALCGNAGSPSPGGSPNPTGLPHPSPPPSPQPLALLFLLCLHSESLTAQIAAACCNHAGERPHG